MRSTITVMVARMSTETNRFTLYLFFFGRCGYGGHGPKAVDATDLCCQVHDDCYRRIAGGFFGCSPKLVTYAWTRLANREIRCTDDFGTCDRNTCECDKAAADCFEKHRATYSKARRGMSDKHDMVSICN